MILAKIFLAVPLKVRLLLSLTITLMVLSAVSELLMVAISIPLLNKALGTTSSRGLVVNEYFYLGTGGKTEVIILITVVVVGSLLRVANSWMTCKTAGIVSTSLNKRAYLQSLQRPFVDLQKQKESDLVSQFTTEAEGLTVGVLHLLFIIAGTMNALLVVTALVVVDPIVTFKALCMIGGSYAVIGVMTNAKIRVNSIAILRLFQQGNLRIREGYMTIRDIKLDSSYELIVDEYQKREKTLRSKQATNFFLSGMPKFAMEGAVLLFIVIYATENSSAETANAGIATVGSLMVGLLRLLPAIQQIYGGWSCYVANKILIVKSLENQNIFEQRQTRNIKPIEATEIELVDATYRYTESDFRLKFSLKLGSGDFVGIYGPSGSGKSTVLDVIMCLLGEKSGSYMVNGESLNTVAKRARWMKSIAHVPQHYFTYTGTVRRNIMLAEEGTHKNDEKIWQALEVACVDNVVKALPKGLDEEMGEGGVKLSGGERQRIAIARAIYKESSLLVMDEATSALDTPLARRVLENIKEHRREKMTLISTHGDSLRGLFNSIISIEGGTLELIKNK